ITIRNNHSGTAGTDMGEHSERIRVQAFGKWITEQKRRNSLRTLIGNVFGAIFLKGAEIIDIAETAAKPFGNCPITCGIVRADVTDQIVAKVLQKFVVVQQRVVNIK